MPERVLDSSLAGIGIGLGALLFAGTLADHGYAWWPGLLGGAACAALAGAATQSLVVRTRARLDDEARAALPVYLEGTAVVLAALAVVAAPDLGRRDRLLRVPAARRAPPRGREVRGPAHPAVSLPPKLVLTVIDGMKPTMLERAILAGTAPALKAIRDRGTYVDDCVAAFPSVTPVCAGMIATGRLQDEHEIPSMNWYSRAERRYVEYGSSFQASRKFGLNRQLVDTIFNMNSDHLAADVPTIFETLDDAGVRTACTSYLIFRGRHPHEVSKDWALTRVASQLFRRSVMGPKELFYADIFASRKTGCWSRMGIPGMRDQHAGCVGSHLVEHELFDFLLLSLPDNDAHSHKHGPHAQIASIAAADAELWRVMEAGGGVERFLDEHAMIVMADHSHTHIERVIDFTGPFSDWKVLQPSGANARSAELALCPAQRSAMVYLLLESRASVLPKIVATALAIEGVDLAMWLGEDGRGRIAGERGELSFAPADDAAAGAVTDDRGLRWDVGGELDALLATVTDGRFVSEHYPDALRRVWSALNCATSGDVLLSAEPAYEFPDWGNRAHVRGGSHGSLHRVDSLGALLFCGVDCRPGASTGRGRWTTSRRWCSRHFELSVKAVSTSPPARVACEAMTDEAFAVPVAEAPSRRRRRVRLREALRERGTGCS